MKKFTFLFVLFFCAKMAFGQWQAKDEFTNSIAEKVFYTNESMFLISEEGNGVYKSTDNGISFEKVISFLIPDVETNPNVRNVFVFGDTIFIGTINRAYKSNNDGVDWTVLDIPEFANHYFYRNGEIYFNDAMTLLNLYKSNDLGQNWIQDYSNLSSVKIFTTKMYNDTLYFISMSNTNDVYRVSGNESPIWCYRMGNEAQKLDVTEGLIVSVGLDTSYKSHLYVQGANGFLLDSVFNDKINDAYFKGDTLMVVFADSIMFSTNNGLNFYKIQNLSHFSLFQSYFSCNGNDFINSNLGLYWKNNNNISWEKVNFHYPIKEVDRYKIQKVQNTLFAKYTNGYVRKNFGEYDVKNMIYSQNNDAFLLDVKLAGHVLFGFNLKVGLMKSINYGDTWTPVSLDVPNLSFDENTKYNVVDKNDSIYLIINKFPDSYYILRSLDYGNTWFTINTESNYFANGVFSEFFFIDDSLFAGGVNSYGSYRLNRITINEGIVTHISPVSVYDNGFCVGKILFDFQETLNLRKFRRSFDYGNTWEYCGFGINSPSYSDECSFYGSDSLIVCLVNNNIFASKNRGFSWFSIKDNLDNKKISTLFFDNDTLFATTIRDSLYFMKASNVVPRIVSGNVFFDNNGNNTFDQTIDAPIPYIHVYSVATGSSAFTDSLGNYQLMLSHSTSNDTVRALNTFLYTNVTPGQYVMNQTDSLKNFAFNRLHSKNDLRVDITSTDIPRPGFLYHVFITCKNEGTTTLNGNLILNHNPFFQYMLSAIAPAQINQSSVAWNFNNFEPLQSYTFMVKFRIDSVTSIIGLPVQMTAAIFPIIGDETPDNNTDSLSNIVVGSFDPNNKTINRAMYLSPQQVLNKSEMIYTVRFQNTGTWYAENVSILDTLHRNLDLSTFRVISASHDYNFDFSGNGIVRFNFPNINLPDSNMNEAASHGFIKYAVRLNNSIPLNDSITNTAHIYFDFNEAIVTNTTLNIVKIDAAIYESPDDFNLNVYPNPAKTVLNIRFEKSSSYNLTIFSIDGRMVMNEKSNSEHHILNIASLDKGIYLLKVSDNNRSKIVKVVIQ